MLAFEAPSPRSWCLCLQGKLADSRAPLERALNIRTKNLGAGHRDTIESVNTLKRLAIRQVG